MVQRVFGHSQQVQRWIAGAVIVVAGVILLPHPSADAGLFSRLFGGGGSFFRGRPVFQRQQWSMQPRQTSCCGNQGQRVIASQGGVVSNNGQRLNTFADRFFGAPVKELDGFSKIVQVGNSIQEKAYFIDRDGRLKFQIRPLTLNADGTLVGATNLDTVSELTRFYVKNRDKFRGGDAQRVNNFLLRYGGFSNGELVLNMNVGTGISDEIRQSMLRCDPALGGAAGKPGASAVTDEEIALSALNFMLNDVSQSSGLIRVPGLTTNLRTNQGDRKEVALDLKRFFRQDALNIFAQSDPLAACTGGRIRLNALIKFATETGNYNKLIQAPPTKDQFAEEYGIAPRKELSPGTNAQLEPNKILIMKRDRSGPDSEVTINDQRIAEFQRVNRFQVRQGNRGTDNAYCFGSYDFIVDGDHRSAQARDVLLNGVHASHDAEEWLCPPPNGFSWRRYLFNKAGVLQDPLSAPANVVRQNINSGLTCLECHNQITLGGGEKTRKDPSKPEFYTENLDLIPSHSRPYFTSNNAYKQKGEQMKRLMLENQCNAGALLWYKPKAGYQQPWAVLPQIVKKFDEPLTEVEAARELGLPDEAFRGRFSGSNRFIAATKESPGNKISRKDFEIMACELKEQALGRSAVPRTAVPQTGAQHSPQTR